MRSPPIVLTIILRISRRSGTGSSSRRCRGEGESLSSIFLAFRTAAQCKHSADALPAFEELFLYACPKFITANSPPYDDPAAISQLLSPPSPTQSQDSPSSEAQTPKHIDPAHRHLNLFLADVAATAPVPTLRSFLKLYSSLDAKKLANFLDADEEEMVQEMMVMKQAGRSIKWEKGKDGKEHKALLEGKPLLTSDLNFVIDDVGLFSPLFPLLFLYLPATTIHRTWSTSRSRRLGDGMRGGLSRTRSARRSCMMI